MKTIGKVKVHSLESKLKENYEDTSEQFLYDFFNLPQSKKEKEIDRILNHNPSWPILYHLSPQREFLMSWYPFDKNSTLLEIGAGCGALTGLFSRKVKNVISNELTEIRAKIIARRFADRGNISIYAGNLSDLTLAERVDYISIVGVLEYAGRFIQVENDLYYKPYLQFLKNLKTFLKPGGHILLAIENKIGVKYLTGYKEDHYGKAYASVENYPNYQGIRTFTKTELAELFKNAGFANINFYYPFPDYKLPYHIFSEDGLGKLPMSISSYGKSISYSEEEPRFSEIPISYDLNKEGISSKFVNAFFVDAQL